MTVRIAPVLAVAVVSFPFAAAAQTPPPPPTPEQVKACVQQMDVKKQWTFDWKTIEVGPPRHPQNAYERAGLRGDADFGYSVHVVYVFNRQATIDDQYWMTHDPQNHWWIAALCRPG